MTVKSRKYLIAAPGSLAGLARGASTGYHVSRGETCGHARYLAMTISDNERFQAAIARFDAANGEDPRRIAFQGRDCPFELLYAERMTHWLEQLEPDASEILRLAARAQHLCRWEIPRSEYPMDRAGYYRWRIRLYGFHAEKAGAILREVGYDEATVARIEQLLQKKNLKSDAEMQLLEDVACLVFLEHYFADFSKEHEPDKVVNILRKTWGKMSPRGQAAALRLDMPNDGRLLLELALAGS